MIPIVFIHQFNHTYLPISLWKARETNPDSEIFLIGDLWNAHFGTMVHQINHQNYSKGSDLLAKRFVNFSSNPSRFELVCLQRWFILLEFMEKMSMDRCLYLDSDVLLFDEISEDANRFQAFGMTVAGISGHTNFVQNRETLSAFCEWILDSYATPEKIKDIETKYLEFCKWHTAGGISDMTYFSEFREAQPTQILDISNPMENKMFDITITYTKGLEEDKGIKKIKWVNAKPYVQDHCGNEIELRSLHFQGESKQFMLPMSGIQYLGFRAIYSANRALIFGQRIIKKLV